MLEKGEIAPNFCFPQYFNISLTSGVKLYIQLSNVYVRFIFPQFCESGRISQGYISESPLDFEIMRVDCSFVQVIYAKAKV